MSSSFCRLDDFENACAAYDKAVELSEDYLTHLNYSITLYSNDEIEKARKQFSRFEHLYRKHVDENNELDPEIKLQADLVRRALYSHQ